MKILKTVLLNLARLVSLAAVVGAFAGWPFCWLSLKIQGFIGGVALTLLFGRFFCSALCPLGIVQTLVHFVSRPRRHVRRVCSRLPETKAQRIVRWSVFVACGALYAAGFAGLATMLLPISIFGKAMTLWAPGLTVAAVVVALALVGDGRFWCNWICPFGTLYNLLSKIAPVKNKVGAGCGNCRRCFGAAEKKEAVGKSEGGVTRRETLKGVAVLAATEKLTDGGYADVSLPGLPERANDVLPPGAGDRRAFSLRCIGCQACIANCPGGVLKPSTRLGTFGQPVMDFRYGYCLLDCVKCGEVCPESAISFLQREQRPHVHLGQAVWKRELCVRTTNGDACIACERKCPVHAIHIVKGFPVVDAGACIGCGACEHACPARPQPAIYVKGYEVQRKVNPMSENDLVQEMRKRLEAGASVVVAKDGVIVAEEAGRGLAPLLKLLDAGKLREAVVVDKVIGRAAAAICAVGGARKVLARMSGKGAAELLSSRGIPLVSEKTVELILNHAQTDSCPMEKAVKGIEDPEKMVAAIRKAQAK